MIAPSNYLNVLNELGISFFAGVPDSLLKDFCAYLSANIPRDDHIIAANEGAALGLAVGYHMGSSKVPMVYLQNSGVGNLVNPWLSLASPEVYGVPMLILVGWRGEPGVGDEPQHVHQGRVMLASFDAMNMPYVILDGDETGAAKQTREALDCALSKSTPVFLVARKNFFSKFQSLQPPCSATLSREDAICAAASVIPEPAAIVSTTGMASRELYEYRERNNQGHHRDFLTVGGMGHASQIALGLAKTQSGRAVFCFDGDGAALMHMGSMAIIGQAPAVNLIHIVFNNGVHDSVGGQPTVAGDIDLCAIARACGYRNVASVSTAYDLEVAINEMSTHGGLSFIECRVKPGNRAGIGRPKTTPAENKSLLMSFLKDEG